MLFRSEAEKLAASFNAYGLPVIETDLWHDDQMPAAIAEESSPITPRPSKFIQNDVPLTAKPINSFQSNANLSVPHIVVTDPSKEQLTPSILSPVSPAEKAKGEQGDDAETTIWSVRPRLPTGSSPPGNADVLYTVTEIEEHAPASREFGEYIHL